MKWQRPDTLSALLATLVTIIFLCLPSTSSATDFKKIELDTSYRHDRFKTQPPDIIKEFRAYTTSFDSGDDDNNDGRPDTLAVPQWVAYELRQTPAALGRAPKRPRPWITVDSLHVLRVAPDDDSYKNSGYSRGHMCMKYHAWRLGANADWNTHTVLNACPQLQALNNGVWRGLEEKTAKWADKYGAVWIICGPVFFQLPPTRWIGDPGEVPVAIPDAFYKIVVKDSAATSEIQVLAFLFPMEGDANHAKRKTNLTPYLTSVDIIEALTGLDFLTELADPWLEKIIHTQLWSE